MLSNYTGAHSVTEVDRWDSRQKERIKVPCPAVVQEYNKNMGGVDLLDALIALNHNKNKVKRMVPLAGVPSCRLDHRYLLAPLQDRLQQQRYENRRTDATLYI